MCGSYRIVRSCGCSDPGILARSWRKRTLWLDVFEGGEVLVVVVE